MVLVFLANGFEDTEAIGTIDILKRAGLNVMTVSINDTVGVSSTHNTRIYADITTAHIDPESDAVELVVLPGGMPGALNLSNNETVKKAVLSAYSKGKLIGAICAAPFVFGELGLLEGKKATCYPGFEAKLKGAEVVKEKVVEDGNIVTAAGMGATFDFGLKLVEKLCGKEKAEEIKTGIIY
ncbi:MAG: DJ-1/PfpI family protein [Ruminococcaceae bacterium]|nr:DJ-1/PfpI family protein [Oscillospiraceae bacterium]